MDFSCLYKQKEVKCQIISTFQSKSHDVLTNEFDYKGIYKDISGISNLLTTLQLIVCNPVSLDKHDSQNKNKVAETLSKFFNMEGSQGSIIYFNGHGNNNGDWILSNKEDRDDLDSLYDTDQVMEFNELYNLYWKQRKNAEQNDHLFLIIDCCSANKWVEKARKFQDISIITAQQQIYQDKYVAKIQRNIGSYFTIYFCNTFNPVQENQQKLKDCISKKFLKSICPKASKKCHQQLFCKHNPMEIYCHMPQPQILKSKFNFQIDAQLKEWSELDTIRKNLINQYHDNSTEYLENIFSLYRGKNRVSVLEELGYDQDECINPYSVHFVNIILYLDERSFKDLSTYSENQKQQSRKITFQFDDLYDQAKQDYFKKMIGLISKRDHVSIDMRYCQINDDQFKVIIDSIVQNSKGNLKTLDLNVSFNQITQKSIKYLFQKISDVKFQNLENLILNFAWNQINDNDITEEEVKIPELNQLKSLCISFNQNTFQNCNLVNQIFSKNLLNIKTLQLLHICLENCGIEDKFIYTLKSFILKNKTLKFFYCNLRQNKITAEGGNTIQQVYRLAQIKGRYHIQLYGNKYLAEQGQQSIKAVNIKEQDSFLELFRSIKYYNK
ncbi:hypothetical protein TTHERM_000420089 (macronuclear) [Tetrahymena thermophila SB210]|uniref:Caspase domain protein n=1 Tax=Tetrahymena thermophila (strain SB210) TaxID=312017 RepID=W7X8B1_TETTS|nr:hypothetical protein TTHERM_000420089 [Tetrahymena thermophila SB210]EWS72643.1 hypothetical protein TTHERM_000420089 [Tetrahymena thermophila SB210]|eukprot:XP_012654811.1 hypothetical protein TTHERM_000420089 [Tetrahymena thermophila SB210]